MKTDTEVQEKISALTKPEDQDGSIRYYAQAAKLLDMDVTEDDIREMLAQAMKTNAEKTQAAAAVIEAVPDSELDQVAGGKNITTCHDTFEQRENCWFDDGCDMQINMYSNYECSKNHYGHTCGDKEMLTCDSFIF